MLIGVMVYLMVGIVHALYRIAIGLQKNRHPWRGAVHRCRDHERKDVYPEEPARSRLPVFATSGWALSLFPSGNPVRRAE